MTFRAFIIAALIDTGLMGTATLPAFPVCPSGYHLVFLPLGMWKPNPANGDIVAKCAKLDRGDLVEPTS